MRRFFVDVMIIKRYGWGMKKYIILIVLFICGCAGVKVPDGFVYEEIETDTFKIATWRKITNPRNVVRIYIEGDGYAFNAKGKPTLDPTPKSDLVRNIAFNDPNDNVIYMGRVCQYVKDPLCEQKYWTTARFSDEVTDAMGQAIIKSTKNPVILIGYSGGGQVAGQIALRKWDGQIKVEKIITIAGNLDHKAWTDYHKLPPLTESSNLGDYPTIFSRWPQIHYVGENDEVIPPHLTQNFIKDQNLIKIVPNADHSNGWDAIYQDVYK